MRFVRSLWLLVFSALLAITAVALSPYLFDLNLSPVGERLFFLAATWFLGISTAVAAQLMHHRSEDAARKAARDEATVHLAGAVAHELNQPLTVVISGAELMAHRERSPEELRALSRRMADASHRMADIVAKLQRVTSYRAKPYVGGVQIVDLDAGREDAELADAPVSVCRRVG